MTIYTNTVVRRGQTCNISSTDLLLYNNITASGVARRGSRVASVDPRPQRLRPTPRHCMPHTRALVGCGRDTPPSPTRSLCVRHSSHQSPSWLRTRHSTLAYTWSLRTPLITAGSLVVADTVVQQTLGKCAYAVQRSTGDSDLVSGALIGRLHRHVTGHKSISSSSSWRRCDVTSSGAMMTSSSRRRACALSAAWRSRSVGNGGGLHSTTCSWPEPAPLLLTHTHTHTHTVTRRESDSSSSLVVTIRQSQY